MSEMIERIARIINPSAYPKKDDPELCWCKTYNVERDCEKTIARMTARTILVGLRDPTDAMTFVAGNGQMGFSQEDVKTGWQLMIDEALK